MEQIKKRLKSLLWRGAGMMVIVVLQGILQMLSDGTINVPAPYVVFAGLIVGEITKYYNT